MTFVRIQSVEFVREHIVRLTLTDGNVCERDLRPLLTGLIFRDIRDNPQCFREVQVQHGTLVWPNGADLCPDTILWNGPPPQEQPTSVSGDSKTDQ